MAWNLKGKVAKCDHREYGFAQLSVGKGESVDKLFEGLGEEMQVRPLPSCSHGLLNVLVLCIGVDVTW